MLWNHILTQKRVSAKHGRTGWIVDWILAPTLPSWNAYLYLDIQGFGDDDLYEFMFFIRLMLHRRLAMCMDEVTMSDKVHNEVSDSLTSTFSVASPLSSSITHSVFYFHLKTYFFSQIILTIDSFSFLSTDSMVFRLLFVLLRYFFCL